MMDQEDYRQELREIKTLLLEIDTKVSLHLAEEEELRPKLQELVEILQKSKGAIALIKFVFYVIAPVLGGVYWLRDHFKW